MSLALMHFSTARVDANPHDLLPVTSMVLTRIEAAAAQPRVPVTPAPVVSESGRPAVLPPLYISFAALQVMDADSTAEAIERGYAESNPFMMRIASNRGAMLAVKAAAAAGTVFAIERLWRVNRKAAILTMLAANAGYAIVVANNYRRARR